MTRAHHWQRNMGADGAFGTTGFHALGEIGPGETIVRTLWAWTGVETVSTTGGFVPGSALTKVGLILRPPGAVTMVNPIDDPTEDWMDIVTCPWRGNITTSTNIDYLCLAGFGPPDKQALAQRFNASGSDFLQLYISWQTWFGVDTDIANFAFAATSSADAYVLEAA